MLSVLGFAGQTSQVLQIKRVRSFNRKAEGTAPDLGWHDTEGARDTEEDCVVVVLSQAVVHEKSTGAAVNVGPRVLNLASGGEDLRDLLVVSLDKLDQVVVLDVLFGEFELANEARVRLAEHSVAISRHDLARLHRDVHELSDIFTSPILAILRLEIEQVVQALLVCQPVERASETVHTSGEGEVRVGQGGADQVSGVGRYIATFVITATIRLVRGWMRYGVNCALTRGW